MNQEKIKEAASKLTVAKFILWAEDMGLDPIITVAIGEVKALHYC
jgi:hypothetical protein